MFKKLRSKRDPSVTVFDALREEFGGYFTKAGNGFRRLVNRYPKPCFMIMVAFMSGSMVFSFVFHTRPRVSTTVAPESTSVGGLLNTADALKRLVRLKSDVDMLLVRDKLSHADSITLGRSLDSLKQIENQINHKP